MQLKNISKIEVAVECVFKSCFFFHFLQVKANRKHFELLNSLVYIY